MTGLTSNEVKELRQKHGYNEINLTDRWEKLKIIMKQFTSPMVYILIIASIISYFNGETIEFVIILAVLILNTLLGFLQESRSISKARELKNLLGNTIAVYRDGKISKLSSRDLVPGDILLLQEGNKIPADCVIKSGSISLNESALTGESLTVTKSEGKEIFSGTYITKGTATAKIIKTGLNTFVGQMSKDLSIKDNTGDNFTSKTKRLTLYISGVSIILFALVILLSILRGQNFNSSLIYAISILVSGIPEGLPALITIALTAASIIIARNGAIVKKLEASEAIGEISTIITDKTGTLTKNVMNVQEAYFNHNQKLIKITEQSTSDNELLYLACKYSNTIPEHEVKQANFDTSVLDPTESALFNFYNDNSSELSDWEQIAYTSFDADKQYQEIIVAKKSTKIRFHVGTPEKIISNINTTPPNYHQKLDTISASGGRSIAIRMQKNSEDWQLLALIHIGDKLRQDAAQTIAKAQNLGVRVIMATGDHPNTALYFAKESGIPGKTTITGEEFLALSEEKQIKIVKKQNIFARMIPEAKKILSIRLKQTGENVGMTGDGVNDAPVLKYADIGIAMGQNGTEIAKESADIILTDDNLGVIIDAIKQGRILFQNIYNAITYLVSTNLGELAAFALCLILNLPAPLAATQILWLNLITDGLNGIALTTEKNLDTAKFSKPVSTKQGFIDSTNNRFLISNSIVIGAGAGLIAWLFGDNQEYMQSLNFVFLSVTQIINLYTCRNLEKRISWKRVLDNKIINTAFMASLILTIVLVQTRLNNFFELQSLGIQEYSLLSVAALCIFLINRSLKRPGQAD